ncbi:MAG: glycosyltransferase family protein [Candidatus Paceibacterota bacterium]
MVAGQLNNIKIGAIIQARMKSTRLPGKVLLPLPFQNGKPLLKWIIDELIKSNLIDYQIVATSTRKENDQLEAFVEDISYADLFRGKEEDVLSRFIEITKLKNLDHVIRFTGDNPFIDIEILNKTIEYHLKTGNDYTNTKDLPIGMNFEIISSNALLNIDTSKLTKEEKEHVTLNIKNSKEFKKSTFRIKEIKPLNNLRLTVDYPSDFALVSILVNILPKNSNPGIKFIQNIKENYPWIFEINEDNLQIKQFSSTEKEIDTAIEILEKLEMFEAVKLIRN